MNGKRVDFFSLVENVGCGSFEIKVHRRMILHFLCSLLIPKILSAVSPPSVLRPSVSLRRRSLRSLASSAPSPALIFSTLWKHWVNYGKKNPPKVMFLLTVSLFVSLPKTFQKQLQILPTSYQNQPKITTKVIRFPFED